MAGAMLDHVGCNCLTKASKASDEQVRNITRKVKYRWCWLDRKAFCPLRNLQDIRGGSDASLQSNGEFVVGAISPGIDGASWGQRV